jgi:hypothetical protein
VHAKRTCIKQATRWYAGPQGLDKQEALVRVCSHLVVGPHSDEQALKAVRVRHCILCRLELSLCGLLLVTCGSCLHTLLSLAQHAGSRQLRLGVALLEPLVAVIKQLFVHQSPHLLQTGRSLLCSPPFRKWLLLAARACGYLSIAAARLVCIH